MHLYISPDLLVSGKPFFRFVVMANEAGQKRYDRQVRIWGPHGQAQLENANICLLNASATGSEALKNLVLGGINAFTIVDGCKVSYL